MARSVLREGGRDACPPYLVMHKKNKLVTSGNITYWQDTPPILYPNPHPIGIISRAKLSPRKDGDKQEVKNPSLKAPFPPHFGDQNG